MGSLKVIALLLPIFFSSSLSFAADGCVPYNTSYEKLIENIANPDSNKDEECQAYQIFRAATLLESDIRLSPNEYDKKMILAALLHESNSNPIGIERLFLAFQEKWFQASTSLLILRARGKALNNSLLLGGVLLASAGVVVAATNRKSLSLKAFKGLKYIILDRIYPARALIFGGSAAYMQGGESKLLELSNSQKKVLSKSPYEYLKKADPEPEKPISEILFYEFIDEFASIAVAGVGAGTLAGHLSSHYTPIVNKIYWHDVYRKIPSEALARTKAEKFVAKAARILKPGALLGIAATVVVTSYSTDWIQQGIHWYRFGELQDYFNERMDKIHDLLVENKHFEAWKKLEEIRTQIAIYRALFISSVLSSVVGEIESRFDSIQSAMKTCNTPKEMIDEKQLKKFEENLKEISDENRDLLEKTSKINRWLYSQLKKLPAEFVTDFKLELSRNNEINKEMIRPELLFKQYGPILTEYLNGMNCTPPAPVEWKWWMNQW